MFVSSFCLLVCLFVCLSLCLFACLCVCLFACLFVCLSVCLVAFCCLLVWQPNELAHGHGAVAHALLDLSQALDVNDATLLAQQVHGTESLESEKNEQITLRMRKERRNKFRQCLARDSGLGFLCIKEWQRTLRMRKER